MFLYIYRKSLFLALTSFTISTPQFISSRNLKLISDLKQKKKKRNLRYRTFQEIPIQCANESRGRIPVGVKEAVPQIPEIGISRGGLSGK